VREAHRDVSSVRDSSRQGSEKVTLELRFSVFSADVGWFSEYRGSGCLGVPVELPSESWF
jgi:hypothetical protein